MKQIEKLIDLNSKKLTENLVNFFQDLMDNNSQKLLERMEEKLDTRMEKLETRMEKLETKMGKLETTINHLDQWPVNQIDNLTRHACVFEKVNGSRSSGFFYLREILGEYYPVIGTCFHSVRESEKQNVLTKEKLIIFMNNQAYIDIFSGLSPDYFDQNIVNVSLVENYDVFYLFFTTALPKVNKEGESNIAVYSYYILEAKLQLKLGEKIVTYSQCDENLKVCIGNYVGNKDKRILVSLDTIGGFSGSLVSNGNSFVGIVTSNALLGNDFNYDRPLNNPKEVANLLMDSMNYESKQKKSYGKVSLLYDWLGREDFKAENMKNVIIVKGI